ncbi:MAG: 2-keto-4-pentenoate hydratase, partial [Myxococcota bacterium]
MRLATLDNGTRDGSLIVVSSSGNQFASASHIVPTLQAALDQWDDVETELRE